MSLKDDLKKSMLDAARARDQVLLDTIRSVNSAIHYKEIDKRGTLTETEIISVIASLCKQRRESIEQFQKGGRQDLADKESRELGILEKFLPPRLSREDVQKTVEKIIGELGATSKKDMGRVIKAAMEKLSGAADGSTVSEITRSLLP